MSHGRAALAGVAVAAVAGLAWSTRRRWAPAQLLELVGEQLEPDQLPDAVDLVQLAATDPPAVLEAVGMTPEPLQLLNDPDQVLDANDARAWRPAANDNVRAFLDTLAWCEGTDQAGGYRCLYGSRPGAPLLFDSFADHPAELGWPGVRLTDEQAIGAGLRPGAVTTAAGRYQITRTTWRGLRPKIGATDFGPAWQDAAALQLIRERGALDDLLAGRLAAVVDKCRRVWASLPGAGYAGQGSRSFDAVAAAYLNAGGLYA